MEMQNFNQIYKMKRRFCIIGIENVIYGNNGNELIDFIGFFILFGSL